MVVSCWFAIRVDRRLFHSQWGDPPKRWTKRCRRCHLELKVTYSSAFIWNILNGSLVIHGLEVCYTPETDNQKSHDHQVSIDRVVLGGIHFFTLLRSHRLILGSLRVEGVTASLDEYLLEKNPPMPKMQAPFTDALIDRLELTDLKVTVAKNEKKSLSLEGSLEMDSVHVVNPGVPGDTVLIGGIRFMASTMRYTIPGADEVVHLSNLELNSKKMPCRLDTLRITPTMDREEIGRAKGTPGGCGGSDQRRDHRETTWM